MIGIPKGKLLFLNIWILWKYSGCMAMFDMGNFMGLIEVTITF